MKNIKYILIAYITLSFIHDSISQINCDLDHLVSVKEAIGEENDTLPVLDSPPPYESFSRDNHEPRLLYFIHGLNGTDEAWSSAHAVVTNGDLTHQFPARKVLPLSPNYKNAQGTLEAARGNVNTSMGNFKPHSLSEDYNFYEGIAIAHSQGGIVGRALDKYYSKRVSGELINADERVFGGLVTVATPNQGAQILNNEEYIHGLVFDLADNLTAGPISEFTSSSNFFVRLMANLVKLEEMRGKLVQFIGNDIGSFLITENMPGITDEYAVPGPEGKGLDSEIDSLNEYEPFVLEVDNNERHTDLVAFYAVADLVKTYYNVEVDEIVGFQSGAYISLPIYETTTVDELIVPISWVTIHFQLNSPNNGIDPFEADNEDYLTAYKAHKTKNFYDSKILQNAIERDDWRRSERGALTSFPPNIFQYFYARNQRRAAEERRNAWERGSVMLSKFDELYRIMIGARYSELVTTTYPYYTDICECVELSTGFTFTFDCVRVEDFYDMSTLDCEEIMELTEITRRVWFNKDSDGVVLAESAMDIPQHTHDPVPLYNVTHMQVRNSIRTAEMLQTVFEGGVGDFFFTEKK